ncbi:Transcriptional regulatory protein UhpA [Pseudogemmobacter humi]|uniref:Transcriptional regulatory protein UhpA n=2 Tax=Pseudogemmobacter humi TaxID=2483812 RepID=A0A3P5X6S2_9RHOB|nr:Transcriptional regulatory protein UhpA [Pseudogemmobacter humi]
MPGAAPHAMLAMKEYERLAFHHAPDATLILSERRILAASLMVETVFGWSPQELAGKSIRILYPGQSDYELIGQRARRAMQERPFYSDARFMQHKSGQAVWMAGRGRALDPADPQRLAIWTYRPLEAGAAADTGLTKAEMRVAGYLVNGFTSKEIGLALKCSPRTVEVHRANMIRKLNVRNSFELVKHLLASVPP